MSSDLFDDAELLEPPLAGVPCEDSTEATRDRYAFLRTKRVRAVWSEVLLLAPSARPLWVISGHVRLREKASALPLKADILGAGQRCLLSAINRHSLDQRQTSFFVTGG
jgi:hypothetical protein